MAVKDKDLVKPSIYALVAGILVSFLFVPLIVGASFLTGGEGSAFGQVAMYILGAVMIFIEAMVGYIFSAMTVYLIYGYLAEGDGVMSKAWAMVKRDFFDLMSLAAVTTVVNLIKNAIKGKGKSRVGNVAAGLIDTVWTEASFLILPAMVIEDFNLKDAAKRAAGIIKENLLLVGISMVGVKAVNGLIGFLLAITGIGLGLGAGYGIIVLSGESVAGIATGIGVGVILAGILIMFASIITSYTSTAYHTCLYLWARDVEKARASGSTIEVSAPAPLEAVLGK